jgi:hypothetical protein
MKMTEQNVDDRRMVNVQQVKKNIDVVPKGFSEVLEEIAPQGEKRKAEELANQTFTILGIDWWKGETGPVAYLVCADDNGELFNFNMGGKVAIGKLRIVQGDLPLRATLKWVEGGAYEGYWDFV